MFRLKKNLDGSKINTKFGVSTINCFGFMLITHTRTHIYTNTHACIAKNVIFRPQNE